MMGNKNNILLVASWKSNVGYAWWLMGNFWVTIANHFSNEGINSYLIYPKITVIPGSIASSGIKTSELDFLNHSFNNLIKMHSFIRKHSIRYIFQ